MSDRTIFHRGGWRLDGRLWRVALAAVLAAASGAEAAASIVLNDAGDELKAQATMSVVSDSNLFATNESVSDLSTIGRVHASYERKAMHAFRGSVDWAVTRFDERSDQDYSAPEFEAELRSRFGEREIGWRADHARRRTVSSLLGGRVTSDSWSAAATFKGPVAKLYSVMAELERSGVSYEGDGFTDLGAWAGRVDLSRQLTRKRSAFVGVGATREEKSSGGDNRDRFYTVGLAQQVFPKVTGTIRAGWQTRTGAAEGLDYGGTTASVDLAWRASPRWRTTLSLERKVNTIANGRSVRSLEWKIGNSLTLGGPWSAGFSAGRTISDFLGGGARSDELDSATVSLGRTFDSRWSASVSGVWSRNRSSVASADYRRVVGTLSLTYSL